MAKPTLFYTPTTVTLPYPQGATEDPGLTRIANVTLGGATRVQRLYRKRVWTLGYVNCDRTIYDAATAVVNAANAANTFPTFSFTEVFAAANGVLVDVAITAFVPFRPIPTIGDFHLTITQATSY